MPVYVWPAHVQCLLAQQESGLTAVCVAVQHPQHRYVVAQVDYMKDALQGIKVTPTFAVFKRGRKVDQFFGPSPQQLRDRVWLHSDDC